MAKKARPTILLECTVCKNRIATKKNPKNTPDRLELNKFCNNCRKVQPHKETK